MLTGRIVDSYTPISDRGSCFALPRGEEDAYVRDALDQHPGYSSPFLCG